MSIKIYFKDREPMTVNGSAAECSLHILNAIRWPSYVSYEVLEIK